MDCDGSKERIQTMLMRFTLQHANGEDNELPIVLKGGVLCGYTGRDQAAVQQHIDELENEGIKPPPSVPAYYPKTFEGIKIDSDIHTDGHETAGEVEFVLFPTGDALYVGLGSDHTDRELERLDIRKSKLICPAIVGKTLWDYNDVKDHWDEIEMRSWAVTGNERVLYQDGTTSVLMKPEELLKRVRDQISCDLDGMSIYSGTLPLETGKFVYADRFEAEMVDPVLNRKISLSYEVNTLDWFNS